MHIIEIVRIGGKVLLGSILHRRVVLSVELGVTYQCGQACKYCVIDDPANYLNPRKTSSKPDMSCEQILSTLDLLGRMGVERINLSGGEPLYRNDIGVILEKACSLESRISLTTNGALVARYLELLKKLDFICISINGTRKTHDYLAGVETHENVLRAIELVKSRDMRVFFSAVVTKDTTENDVGFLLKLAEHYDAACVFQPVFDGCYFDRRYVEIPKLVDESASLRHLENIFEVIRKSPLRKRVVGGKDFIDFILNAGAAKASGRDISRLCSAGNCFFYISPSGDMFPCSLRFRKMLEKKFYEYSAREINQIKVENVQCAGCSCYSNNLLDQIGRLDWRALTGILMNQYVR